MRLPDIEQIMQLSQYRETCWSKRTIPVCSNPTTKKTRHPIKEIKHDKYRHHVGKLATHTNGNPTIDKTGRQTTAVTLLLSEKKQCNNQDIVTWQSIYIPMLNPHVGWQKCRRTYRIICSALTHAKLANLSEHVARFRN